MFDYLTYTTGLSKLQLGTQYSLRGVLSLFFRCQIFEHVDNLSGREFLDEEGAQVVGKTLKELRAVFFKPLPPDPERDKARAIQLDDSLLDQLSVMALFNPWVKFEDRRPK